MITRRTFTTLLAAPALAAPKLKLGIGTYSYHSLSVDDMVTQIKKLGITEIEMSRGEFMLFRKPKPEQFESARSKFDRAGLQCVSYYAATIHDEAELDAAIRNAKILGSRNITADATGASLLKLIDEKCTTAKLTLGIHNHFFKGKKFPYESPDEVLGALKGLSKTVGATLDTGQFASCGQDTVGAVRKLAPYLKMVHLKDIEASGAEVNVLLGKGIAKIPEVIAELHKVNYKGLVAIEYEKEGAVEEDMRAEVEWARQRL
jgi:sugar phosphate isomerase/epimerase